MKKRGQVTIFIIVAIIIVSGIALFFLFKSGVIPEIGGPTREITPAPFLDTCLEDKIAEGVKQISLRGGSLNPILNIRFLFEGESIYRNISYLCYTAPQGDPDPCRNQKPLLVRNIKNEIENYIYEEVKICFNELVSSIENQGYEVGSQYNGFQVELEPKKIIVNIDGKITSTKAGQTSTQENFEISILSRLFDILLIVQDIVEINTLGCNYDPRAHILLYPEFDIDQPLAGDSHIYSVQYRETEEKFRFAIRGCVLPPGI